MSFVEVSELKWASQLMGARDFKQEFLRNFQTRSSLGRGSYGKVFWARSTRDGKRWTSAAKLIESKSDIEDEEWLAYWARKFLVLGMAGSPSKSSPHAGGGPSNCPINWEMMTPVLKK